MGFYMYESKRILALIPARGGSKGVPRKNIYPLCGKPLIAYTIEAALQSGCCDSVVVSTDDAEIAAVARQYGADVPFMRPESLSLDNTKTIDVEQHALRMLEEQGRVYDWIILLQPTSPLRDAQDIQNAIRTMAQTGCASLASVSPVQDHPMLIRTVDKQLRLRKLLDMSSDVRRQDFPQYYRVNGAIYINTAQDIYAGVSQNDNDFAYVMTPEHSVDIDSHIDFAIAEYYLL